jgi:hypothetical protein
MVIKMTIGEARNLVEQLKEDQLADQLADRLEVLAEWLAGERPGHSFAKQYKAWKGLEKPETGRKQVATALRGEVEQYFAQQYAMGTARTATARFSMNTRARADARGVTLTHAADEARRAYGDFRSGSEHIPLTAAMGANPDAFIDELLAQKDTRKLLPSEVWKLDVATYYLLGQRDEPKRRRIMGPSSPVIQPKPLPTMYQGVATLPPRTSPWRSLDDRRGWVDYRRDRRDSYARKTAALLLAGLVGVGGGAVVTEIKAAKGTTDRLSDAEDTWRRMIGASLDVSLPSMREKLGDRESFGSESIGDDENGSNKVVWELDPRNGANANGYWPVEVDDYLAVSTSAGKLPPYEPLSISVQQLHQASAGFSYLPLMGYDNRASRVETQDVRIARELRVPRTLEDMSDRLLIRVTGDQLLSLGEGSALDESYVDDTGRTVRAIGLPVPVLADSDIVAINVTLRDIDSKKKLNKQVPLKVYQLRDGTFRILMRPESIPPGTYGEVEYWLDPQAKTDWKVSAQTPMGAGYYQPKDYESSINRKPENYREVINDSSFLQDVLSPEDVQGVLRALRLPAGATASQVAEAIQKYYKYSFTPYKDAHAKSDQRPYRSDNESELLPLHEILANVAVGETGLSSQVCTTAFMLGLLAGRGLNGPDNYVNAVRGYRTGNQDNTLSLGEKHMWGADDQGDIIEGTPAGEQVPSAKPEKDVSHLNPILIAEILAGAVAASAAGYGLRRGIPAGIRYGRRRRREYAEQWFEDHREQHVGDLALARHVVYMPQSGVPYDSSSQRPSSVALKASFEVGKLLGTLPRYSKAEIRDMIIANADIIVDAGINPNRLRRRLYKIRSRSQYMEKPKGQPKAKADTKRRSKK